MSDADHVLGLLDDLMKLIEGSPAAMIEVEADGFAVTVTRRGGVIETAGAPAVERQGPAGVRAVDTAAPSGPKTQKVHASSVGIFNGPRSWNPGDAVTRGEVLGGIQTLGHVSEIKAPADGQMREVLVTTGAPVEYGQALFVITVG
jgi:acetyl-CoA carboxylase biotin carboxyl carrier protein